MFFGKKTQHANGVLIPLTDWDGKPYVRHGNVYIPFKCWTMPVTVMMGPDLAAEGVRMVRDTLGDGAEVLQIVGGPRR